jgi:hypothetical protein
MKILKKLVRVSRLLCFAFLFAMCMVLGVVPIMPKRKEQFDIEVKIELTEKERENTASFSEPG